MPTLVREASSKPIGQLVIPYRGTWRSVAANILQPDQLYDSLNVFIREGRLRDRPGLALLNPTEFENDVIGGTLVVTPSKKIMLAFTRNALYRLEANQAYWAVDTQTGLAMTNDSSIHLTFLETASQYVCVIANAESPLKKWIDGQGVTDIVPTKGVVPIAQSICTAASRIVALVDNHTILWTDVLTYDAWGPLNYNKKAAETNDAGICVKSLGSYDFVLYKERSIYLGKAQGGSEARAFSMQLVQEVEGPADGHSVVNVGGYHVFMTPNGRIGRFDGASYVTWIGDGLWFYLQRDIDPAYSYKILGVFDYRLHVITFYYPRIGDGGKMRGMVTINVPLDGSGINDFSCFLGVSGKAITHGYEMRFNRQTNRSVLFSSDGTMRRSYLYNEDSNLDDQAEFPCMMQTGLLPMPDMKHNRVTAELFIERADGNGSVDVSFVTSDALENSSGTIEPIPSSVLALEFNPVREYIAADHPTRFVGLRLDWTSTSTVRYTGAVLYGREVS